MILFMKMFWKCLLSPRLHKIYRDGPLESLYQPRGWQKWGDKVITSTNTILNVTFYTSPLISFYIYKRGFFTMEEYQSMAQYLGGVSMLLMIAFLVRAYGRVTDPKYLQFLRTLQHKPNQRENEYIAGVQRYDFEFSHWPTTFEVPVRTRLSWFSRNPFATGNLLDYKKKLIQLLAFIATHTFAIRLIYPGSLGVIHNLLWMPLMQGRANMVENYNGQRAKLKTSDGNTIDSMFVDKRWSNTNGDILVVCCEGNSGFYEVGIMATPVKAGYSALGWNHPGFAESTGLPYPAQEHNAIDTVMRYAIEKLNFKPENIVMFGWSIGGYSAAWAAATYSVKGLVLDATFDDLLPLAKNHMPASWDLLVREVVRSYANLNVSELLKQYLGPVHLVRRTDDEIICLRPGRNETNRGNQLVLEIIKQRHPEVFASHKDQFTRYANMLSANRPAAATAALPADHLVLKHLARYMRDYKSSHCTPLPDNIFEDIMNQVICKTKNTGAY